MTRRERMNCVLSGTIPDRIPIDFWAGGEVFDRLAKHLGVEDAEAVRREFDVDVRFFRGPGLPTEKDAGADAGFTDHWGVERVIHTVKGTRKDGAPYTWAIKQLSRSPLAMAESVKDIEKHNWPDPAHWDYSRVHAACCAIRDGGHMVIFGGDRLDRTAQLKAGMYLRGMEQFVMDLVMNPAIAESILEHIAAYYMEYNRRVFEAADGAIDIFFMGDDMGTQRSTWVSVGMYRQFFKKRFSEFNALAHEFDIKTMYHTCGCVTDLVGEFVDAGLDILQSLQPSALGESLAALKKQYGRDLCFQGGIDIQDILPKGSPADVRQHVREVAETLGQDGGYIFGTAHNILPDTPTENVLALVDAYREFGSYGNV